MISTRWFAIQIQAVATTSCILELIWISYSIINVKILVLIKWSYRSSQLCWLLNLVWLACFEHVVQSLKYISFWCSFLDPHLTTHHTNTGIQVITNVKIGHVYLACEPGDIFCFALGNRPIFATHGCLCCVFCMWRTGVESTYWWQGKVNILLHTPIGCFWKKRLMCSETSEYLTTVDESTCLPPESLSSSVCFDMFTSLRLCDICCVRIWDVFLMGLPSIAVRSDFMFDKLIL